MDLKKMRTSKPELVGESNGSPMQDMRELQKTMPVRVENKNWQERPLPLRQRQ